MIIGADHAPGPPILDTLELCGRCLRDAVFRRGTDRVPWCRVCGEEKPGLTFPGADVAAAA